jgi:hypothetical protein
MTEVADSATSFWAITAMKDRSFSEEREWRLISRVNRLPIRKSLSGLRHRDLARSWVLQLVESEDIKCGVRPSFVPYRNW